MAVVPVVMPRLGESVVEATLSKWLVKPGDSVQADQTIAEASTDKADTELPSPAAGKITKLLVSEGQTVAIGTPIAEIDTAAAGAAVSAVAPAPVAKAPAIEPSRKTEAAPEKELELPSAPVYTPPPAAKRTPSAPRPPPARPVAAPLPAVGAGGKRSSPLVRRMARDYHVDLSLVPGTGAGGRVNKRDFLDWLEKRAPGSPTVSVPDRPAGLPPDGHGGLPPDRHGGLPLPIQGAQAPMKTYKPPEYRPLPGDEVLPFTRRRRLIAEHMVYSKHTSPHVFCLAEIDMHKVDAARKASAKAGKPVSFLAYVAAAVVRAIKDVPVVNATVLPDAYAIHKVVNLGIAVDTPEGLVVPVLHGAQDLDLAGFTKAVAESAEKARSGKLTADDLSGGTLTLSNPGLKGNTWGAAVINQPQVAILRMGSIVKRPVVAPLNGEDTIVIRPIMQLVLSYDHRIIDGVAANSYLFRVRELLESPELLG
ncbi:MAG TPA: dihydrolipoamide acetyltransferase family protein [Myxococcales bacterium]|jgi:2-oxoglutarate dehydrogenase E2 component (dihydrolipoamide succinyltransferase)